MYISLFCNIHGDTPIPANKRLPNKAINELAKSTNFTASLDISLSSCRNTPVVECFDHVVYRVYFTLVSRRSSVKYSRLNGSPSYLLTSGFVLRQNTSRSTLGKVKITLQSARAFFNTTYDLKLFSTIKSLNNKLQFFIVEIFINGSKWSCLHLRLKK